MSMDVIPLEAELPCTRAMTTLTILCVVRDGLTKTLQLSVEIEDTVIHTIVSVKDFKKNFNLYDLQVQWLQ